MLIYYHPKYDQLIAYMCNCEGAELSKRRKSRPVSIRKLMLYGPEALGWIYIAEL